jgi:hypothetical protein
MTLRFLGKETQTGNSPTLWADGEDYVIQGYTPDAATLDAIGRLPTGEAAIRVPKRLMTHLAKDVDGATDV